MTVLTRIDFPRPNAPIEILLNRVKREHPRTYSLLDRALLSDPATLDDFAAEVATIQGHSDFDETARGGVYRLYQKSMPLARQAGDLGLFAMLETGLGALDQRHIGVDIIGGNGTTPRTAGLLRLPAALPYIISADPNADMVADALDQGLPALWQGGQRTLFARETLDFVLASRGFHHVPRGDRQALFGEAFRILRPGGVFLGIDFEEGTPTADWYAVGLDRYTATGHVFDHFTRAEMLGYASAAGFAQVEVLPLYDPFRVDGDTAETAMAALYGHLIGMFGLEKLAVEEAFRTPDYYCGVAATLAPFACFEAGDVAFEPGAVCRPTVTEIRSGCWRAEYPRIALCVRAIKG